MGVFDVPCAVSGLALSGPTQLVLVGESPAGNWQPVALPIAGTYDRYGSIDGFDQDLPNVRALASALRRLEPTPEDDVEDALRDMNHGVTENAWYRFDGTKISFALVDDGIYRAMIGLVEDGGRGRRAALQARPWRTLLEELVGRHPFAQAAYSQLQRPGADLEQTLVDFALFQHTSHTWLPIDIEESDQYCGLTGDYGCEQRVIAARQRFGGQPRLLAAVEANAAQWAELDDQ